MEGIAEGRLEKAVTVEFLHTPKCLGVVGLTRDCITTFEICVIYDGLAEKQI